MNARLTAANRELSPEKVYLHFDRLFFEPGEAIWFQAYVRDANSLKASPMSDVLYVQLLAPNGSVVREIELLAKDGSAAGDFQLPPTASGGLYKIKAWTNWMRNFGDTFERDVQVQASVLPRLRMELDFEREAYGPGDAVTAKLDLNSLANEPLANHDFTATVSLAGQQFTEVPGKTDAAGKAQVHFDLPKKLDTNDGLLNVRIGYQGQTESISRSVPIVLNRIDLQFLPEGGNMVAGLPATMAFKALNEFGKPADVEGNIVDERGVTLASFRSYHQGMGAFEMVPAAGQKYFAKLTKPVGIDQLFDLPQAEKKGVALEVSQLTLSPAHSLAISVHSTENEALTLAVVAGGEMNFTTTLPAQSGTHRVEVPTGGMPIGIAQVTVFDSREQPVAERMFFVNPHKKLNVQLNTDKPKYLPKEKVELTLTVTDERGQPVAGQFSLAVCDDNLLTFADDKQGHILSHLLLQSDLRGEVVEPNFYFDPPEKHPEKDQLLALDYLLLTQGWRRFGWEKVLSDDEAVAMQFPAERATVQGTVTDKNGQSVPRMLVRLEGTELVALTDEQGRFELDPDDASQLAQGVVVRVEHPQLGGYAGRTRSLWEKVNIQLPLNSHSFRKMQHTSIVLQDVATAGNATLQGTLTDEETGEPLIFATVAVYHRGVLVTGTETDLDGFYSLTELIPGDYEIEFSYTGYEHERITDVSVLSGKTNRLDGKLGSGMQLMEVVVAYSRPLVQQDNTTSGTTIDMGRRNAGAAPRAPRREKAERRPEPPPAAAVITAEEVKNLPTRNVNALASLGAGVTAEDGEAIAIRGSRSNATDFFIDGVRVSGNMVPRQDFQPVEEGWLTGTPASFAADEVAGKVVFEFKEIAEPQRVAAKKQPANAPRTFYTPRIFPKPDYAQSPITSHQSPRTDFRKTLHWQPIVHTGADGKATVEFFTSDAITTFRATVEGITAGGQVGRAEQRFFTQMPFAMDAKLPTSLLSGDQLAIPVALTNNTDEDVEGKLSVVMPAGFSWVKKLPGTVRIPAGETVTVFPELAVGSSAVGSQELQINFSAPGFEDSFEQAVKVQHRGFPVELVMGGNEAVKTFAFDITEPLQGSLSANFQVHPSVLSDLTSGLERMLRQPGGCFEQTSSSNYPNVLVLDFLQKTNNSSPAIEQQAKDFLKSGYQRLTSFEIAGGGFDWFGSPPAHEALSAYGLMEFVDMQAVFPVEQALIDRTAEWLLTRRDGQGGWLSSKQGAHSWQRPGPVADAYITWSMTEAGHGQQVLPEANKTLRDATDSKDSYLLALAANILLNLDDQRAAGVLSQLEKLQAEDGSWTGLTHSVVHSTGQNLTVETTALATLAFLQNGQQQRPAQRGVDFLAKAKTPYGFGSTQATVLALKALVAHAMQYRQAVEPGSVELFVNGAKIGEQAITAGQDEPVSIAGFENLLVAGRNRVEVRFANADAALPYDLSIRYNTRQPRSSEACKVDLQTVLKTQSQAQNQNQNGTPCQVGETVRLNTTLSNRHGQAVPNPIAIVGIPAGLSVQPWQVKELQERKLVDFYELKDGYVVFYFRQLEAGERKVIHLDLKADLPGSYEAPASLAYLYYSNEEVVWSKPERVTVGP